MKVLRLFLFPISVIYDVVTTVRNKLYDLGYKPAVSFEIPVISIGNLAVGGTGKTPMIEHLIRLYENEYNVATLSRGYGRKTKGFRIANDQDNASTIGDEPFQFYKKFKRRVTVAVGEERAYAIPLMLQEHTEIDMILLDDAYQHRKVKPSFQLLLTDYNNLFYDDFLMPSGMLRESRTGSERADAIIVTKCPGDVTDEQMMHIEDRIRVYVDKPVFFSCIRYGEPILINDENTPSFDKVILVTGIANASPLVSHIKKKFSLIHHFAFSDHYDYKANDIIKIREMARLHQAKIITTEKDAVKLDLPAFRELMGDVSYYYLPIEIEFVKNGEDFDEMMQTVLKSELQKKY